MKHFILAIITLLNVTYIQGQSIIDQNKTIRVSGYAEIEIVPNEIYLSFTIKERQEGKTTIKVDDTEKILFTGLNKLSIDPLNLSIGDIDANSEKINWRKKGVQTSTKYHLKLKDSKEVYDVLDLLELLKVKGAFISKINHSQNNQLEKEVKISAIKDAKKQAKDLTLAINEKIDGVLKIERLVTVNPFHPSNRKDSYRYAKAVKYDSEIEDIVFDSDKSTIKFKKVKFTSSIDVIFKIE